MIEQHLFLNWSKRMFSTDSKKQFQNELEKINEKFWQTIAKEKETFRKNNEIGNSNG